MTQGETANYFLQLWRNALDSPTIGLALVVTAVIVSYLSLIKQRQQFQKGKHTLSERISEFSSPQQLQRSFQHKKQEEEKESEPEVQPSSTAKAAIPPQKSKISGSSLKQQVKEKYLQKARRSLSYESLEERREKEQKKRQKEEQQLMKARKVQQEAREAKEKEERARLKKVSFEQAVKKNAQSEQPSDKILRPGQRKTTIQKDVQQNEQKDGKILPHTQTNIPQPVSPMPFNTAPTAPTINLSFANVAQPSTPSLFSINAMNPEKPSNQPASSQKPKPENFFPLDAQQKEIPSTVLNEPPKTDISNIRFGGFPSQPQSIPPTNPIVPPPPVVQPSLIPQAPPASSNHRTLSSFQYFQTLMKFANPQSISVQIPTIMANLGGAKSSLNDLLTFAQSFLDTINKSDDAHLTTFAVKIFQGIVRQISTSNLKDGIYRIPPKSKTDQVQKNSINCYILYINLYRLMGYEKIWVIVFGKLLKMLEFVYKRKEDLKKYTELELLANKHLEKRGEIEGKYLSRIDYLTYLLLGLTAYDPILIFRQIQEKDGSVRASREQIESWGREWSYKEFWMLIDLILKNKHDSYFKPVIYMNILSALYPRIYTNKQSPQKFKEQNQLYKLVLEEGKKYFAKFKNITELKNLKESEEGSNFEYDGDNFVQGIKVLESRLTVEKAKEFNLRSGDNGANAREFQAKSNVFYYFCKER